MICVNNRLVSGFNRFPSLHLTDQPLDAYRSYYNPHHGCNGSTSCKRQRHKVFCNIIQFRRRIRQFNLARYILKLIQYNHNIGNCTRICSKNWCFCDHQQILKYTTSTNRYIRLSNHLHFSTMLFCSQSTPNNA